ncbi:MAG: 30S ribosomal protein S16 [Tenericutes bacterium ADurb.Bin087]|nr:MAG: 30S ribosomal protein S16 [Tenericutes bacterium ADurb.Bin087]
MAVKIRLTRVGRTHDPHYRIVAADSRYARDGRIIEQIGHYDPKQDFKAAIIDRELALKWLGNGAQPSATVKALFRAQGINEEFLKSKKSGK